MRVDIHGAADGQREDFERALLEQCGALGIELTVGGTDINRDGVTVVFCEAGHAWQPEQTALFEALAQEERAAVLPVIAAAPDAAAMPQSLQKYNAFQTSAWGEQWPAGLVDEVLSLAWLHRRERKVFISYKRSDSAVVANQLYEQLTRRQYVTFLDDVSIDKGADFQRQLKWWLNDADLLLVLLSPNFPASPWCLEEINFARSRFIGVLVLEWPDSVYGNPPSRPFIGVQPGTPRPTLGEGADADQRLRLTDADFTGSRVAPLQKQPLTTKGLSRVLVGCARQRSLAVRQRLEELVPLAEEMLAVKGGMHAEARLGDFRFTNRDQQSCFVRILPFRPDPRTLWEACRQANGKDVGGCFYSECDGSDDRAKALRWLANRPHDGEDMAKRSQLWACSGDEVL